MSNSQLTSVVDPTKTKAWARLLDFAQSPPHMPTAFAQDPNRAEDLSISVDQLFVDMSRNLWTVEIRDALLQLAEETDVLGHRDRMFAGAAINTTEGRAVWHTALRAHPGDGFILEGDNVVDDVTDVLNRVFEFAEGVRTGAIVGATGQRFRHVVNIGIGGSDLGPLMVTEALAPFCSPDLSVHFVSNVDGSHLHDTLMGLNPQETLFIIASKTFTTDETMTNALAARDWVVAGLPANMHVGAHFAAVSAAVDKAEAFGIAADRVYGFWDWVGGRYSLWSSIGLPIVMAIGADQFRDLLDGARHMDQHFRTAEPSENLPLLMGVLGVWYRNFLDAHSIAILPYDQHLHRLPAYLQQADMESNGKGVRRDGAPVSINTGPILWGEPGTNGQHAFYQLIHQGTALIPIDFLVAANADTPYQTHHQKLVANCLAQGEALMQGKTAADVRADMKADGIAPDHIEALVPHRVFPGNRPSTTLMYPRLTPYMLGQLIASYEHKIFVQGAIWGVNSYDQWGVELGKAMAKSLLPAVQNKDVPEHVSASTQSLVLKFHTLREQ